MARRLSNADLEALVKDLGRVGKDPEHSDAEEILRRALEGSSPHARAKAAGLIAEQRRGGFAELLLKLYGKAFENPAKVDPGCRLKLAAMEVLDFQDHDDPEPFLRGVRHVQSEATWGEPADTAGPLRVRCALALVRLRYPAVLDLLADLLADGEAQVRSGAATAVAYNGDEKGSALLRLKLHLSDPEPDVVTDTLKAYLSLDPEQALPFAERLLLQDQATRQGALMALGESRRPEALALISGFASRATLERDQHVACIALASLRTEASLETLLDWLASGSELRASCALEGLSLLASEPGLGERVREAEARNSTTALGRTVRQLFPES